VRLKPKFIDLTIDNIPDTEDLKALTTGPQTIAGQVTFSRAPRVSVNLIEPDGDNLVTRGQVEAVIEEIKAASAGIHWEITEDGARIITNPPYVSTPTPKPTCHIEYRTVQKWVVEISWFCVIFEGDPGELQPGQSYDSERGVLCTPVYERKLVEVREPYEVCQ
jgi:hypothetical protein